MAETSSAVSKAIWRAVDANINRASEGLRLLEDITRFSLNNADLCRGLRAIRHYLAKVAAPLQKELISARDAAGDIGREAEFEEEPRRQDLAALVRSNSRRVQEALRTLEELGKLPGMEAALDWAKLKEFRFTTYDIEKELISKLLNIKD